MPLCIKVNDSDNVAIAVVDIEAESLVSDGLTAVEAIPQAHKIALADIPAGGEIVRYGVVIGYALNHITKGSLVDEHSLSLPVPPALDEMPWGVKLSQALPKSTATTWMGYASPDGGYAGTRNILAIHTTVQCVTGVLNVAVEKIKNELLPKFPHVDGVVPINHAYGCGVAINAPEAVIPIRALKNLVKNPNFGSEIMLIGLGCEKLTPDMLLTPEDNTPENVIILQELDGFEAMLNAIISMAEKKLKKLDARRREELPLSKLIIGMQCGGSDAFSGITSNPAAGYASDMLVTGGATVLFSEVTEVRDGVYLLAERCPNIETRDRLAAEMKWYDHYLELGGADRSANPAPGNKKGGLSNIVEKAMGSIAKSGNAPIVEVLSPGERPEKQGLIFAAAPASDIVCGPMLLASGITLQVFMTGRGTPYNLACSPVIKVSSRTNLKRCWNDLIDVDAGTVAIGENTIQGVGEELFSLILEVAGGRQSLAEKWKLYNDLCIFNPAPIT